MQTMRMVEHLQEKFVKTFFVFVLFCRHIDLKYIKLARNFLVIILYAKDIVLNECAIITKFKKKIKFLSCQKHRPFHFRLISKLQKKGINGFLGMLIVCGKHM